MADALASGASVRKGVGVQIPPRAHAQGSSRKWGTSVPESSVRRQVWPGFVVVTGRRLACEVVSLPAPLAGRCSGGERGSSEPSWSVFGQRPARRVLHHESGLMVFFETCSSRRVLRDGRRRVPRGSKIRECRGCLRLVGPGRGLCSVRRPGRRVDPVPFEDDRLFVAATTNPMKMVRTTGSVPVDTQWLPVWVCPVVGVLEA